MKATYLLVFFLTLFISSSLWGQKYSREYGVIARDEFELTSYEKDPEAEAVILFDIGDSFFEYSDSHGFNIRFTRKRRIKILSEAGLEYADFSIPYYSDGYGRTERVQEIKATVYNLTESNQIIKSELDKSAIYTEQKSEKWWVKKFALPNVKVGSIIEFQYQIWSPFHFNLPDWAFQDRIPTIFSEYTVRMIPWYEYVYLINGEQPQVKSYLNKGLGRSFRGVDYHDMVYTFTKQHVPAFKDESYITSREDYISKIDFQLAKVTQVTGGVSEIISTWPELIKEYFDHQNFGKYLKHAEKYAEKELLPSLELAENNLLKTKQLIEYVKNNYSWSGYYGDFATDKFKRFLEAKEGNAAEINLFAISLLNAAGIEAHPVVLSTRDHGKIYPDYPFSHFLNYVVVLANVDGNLILSDATESNLAFDRIPPRCINETGLVVQEDKEVSWIGLNIGARGSQTYSINLTIDPNQNMADYMLTGSYKDLSAYQLKSAFGDDTTKIRNQLQKGDYLQVRKTLTRNYERKEHPYMVAHTGLVPIEKIGNQIVIQPFLNIPDNENKLKQDERNHPIDFVFEQEEAFETIINIPENYELGFAPKNFDLSDELLDLHYKVEQIENKLKVIANYQLKKAVYPPEDYLKLKKHFDQLISKLNESILLKPGS